jgi:hypothetical protein
MAEARRRLKGDGLSTLPVADVEWDRYREAERQAWERFAAETQLMNADSAAHAAREVAVYADLMLEQWRLRFAESPDPSSGP